MLEITVSTSKREEFVDITEQVRRVCGDKGWQDGVVLLHCAHTTAGLTVNESADPSVCRDILAHLRQSVPHMGGYEHAEGNSDAHIKSSLMGCSQQVLVGNGRLVLGTWQGIFFTEFDGPRQRRVWLQWIPA